MAHTIEVELDRNYAAFVELLPALIANSSGSYALLKDQRLEGVFESAGDAARAGYARFGDNLHSIQHITSEVVDLGFYSYGYSNG